MMWPTHFLSPYVGFPADSGKQHHPSKGYPMFAAEQIDLSGAWARVWVQMQAGLTPGFMQLLTAVG